ncbi:hypothetical protein PF008_g9471 [Phytophthora fragariae]|uniref:Uncharacterized protein n=1 Tax=Phytophthora fragariae TaxID=53985 RepID=A0A6G0RWN8_9STRA|nr:hypothetical protein PF008_g9471 [Phytophthora fragariae]
MGAHLGRENTFAAVPRDFFWAHMYKWAQVGSHLQDLSTGETVEVIAGSPATAANCD